MRHKMTSDEASVLRYNAETKTQNLWDGKEAQIWKSKIEMVWSAFLILSRAWGSVTNNNGFWMGWLDLLIYFFTVTFNHNQLERYR
jgi:hypothetical protein